MTPIQPDSNRQINQRGWIHAHSASIVDLFRLVDVGWIFFGLWVASQHMVVSWSEDQLFAGTLATAFFTIFVSFRPLYRSWRLTPLRTELIQAALTWLAAIAALSLLGRMFHFTESSDDLLAIWALVTLAGITGTRIVIRTVLRKLRQHGSNIRTAAIAGANSTGLRVAYDIQSTRWMGLRLIGFFDDRQFAQDRREAILDNVGTLNDLVQKTKMGDVDIIYITLPLRAELRINEFIRQLHDTTATVYYVPDFSAFGLLQAHWETMRGLPIVSLIDTPHQGFDAYSKRAFDIAGASLILLLVAFPMILIALAIGMTSKGPIIFRQIRYGLGGKTFYIWKFRTMIYCDNGDSEFRQAQFGDSRVTALGKFLRRSSLDELPQLFNVLQGTMSLVGPRPHPVALNESQRKVIDRYMLRHKVRPGITGWAQVNGFRGETDTVEKMQKRIEYDLSYINNWSIGLDLRILLRTISKVFSDPAAY
jgi:putative colanic acid biosynthesis UDP-glucose lipid carrier transferase